MSDANAEDPEVEARWCADRRADVARYLEVENHPHGRIGDWPAWHVAPYVSIWAIESHVRPGWVGAWVICGDLPSDVISAVEIKDPRKALSAFAERWQQYAASVRAGTASDDIEIAGVLEAPETMLPMLEARARLLDDWARDDSLWSE